MLDLASSEGLGSTFCARLAAIATEALGDESEDKRIERNPFRTSAGSKLRMNGLRYASYKLAGRDPTAVGSRNGHLPCLQGRYGSFECVTAVLDGLVNALAV